METTFKTVTLYLAAGVEAVAAIVIGIAVLQAALRIARSFVSRADDSEARKEAIRLRLGRWLAVALEVELAADILRTAVAPSWNDIGKLGAIIVLRTLLNYFLQREISLEKARDTRDAPRPGEDDAADLHH